jgi:hypothetical protein
MTLGPKVLYLNSQIILRHGSNKRKGSMKRFRGFDEVKDILKSLNENNKKGRGPKNPMNDMNYVIRIEKKIMMDLRDSKRNIDISDK